MQRTVSLPRRWKSLASGCLVLCALIAPAQETIPPDGRSRARVAFPPHDDAQTMIAQAISEARRQVLVQAFTFTNRFIARALLDAARRGVEVQVIADREQFEKGAAYRLADLKAGGIKVWLDGEHAAAHNKIVLIDAGQARPIVITGSFNFTQAAQKQNAENVLLIDGNAALAKAYLENWQRHRAHATPLNQ
jgi:phosphatidylserine/phosphatidylglycerophosphate/cardiolipin synthase-like enzyme